MTHSEEIEKRIGKTTLYVLDQFNQSRRASELRSEIRNHWIHSWQQFYKEVGNDDGFHKEDFERQNHILAICKSNELVGYMFSTYISLEHPSRNHHPYLEIYPSDKLAQLRERGVQQVMSQEYLTVTEGFRKRELGFSFGDSILTLSSYLFQSLGLDGIIAATRRSHQVHTSVYKLGFRCLVENICVRNFGLDLVWARKEDLCSHPDPTTHSFSNQLWHQRVDLRQKNPAHSNITKLKEIR